MNSARINNIIRDLKDINNSQDIEIANIEKAFVDYGLKNTAKQSAFVNESHLVEEILQSERRCFIRVFRNPDIRNKNAIETLFIIASDMQKCYDQINPLITSSFKKYYPLAFNKHINYLSEFISAKLSINLANGKAEGLYKSDYSADLLIRMYLKRFVDIMNPDVYSAADLDFKSFYKIMISDYYYGFLTEDGKKQFNNIMKDL